MRHRRTRFFIVLVIAGMALLGATLACAFPGGLGDLLEEEVPPAAEQQEDTPTVEPTDEPTVEPTEEADTEGKSTGVDTDRPGKSMSDDAGAAVSESGTDRGQITLSMVNDLGVDVCYVAISPPDETMWGDDWLGPQEIIHAGQQRSFTLDAGEWDIMAADCDENQLSVDYHAEFTTDTRWVLSTTAVSRPPADGDIPFTVANSSSDTLCYLYVSPTADDDWGADWLGNDTIAPGSSSTFYLTEGEWDIMARDCSREPLDSVTNIVVEDGGNMTWTLTDRGFEGSYQSTQGEARLTVVNALDLDVCWVYISPNDSSSWGPDWLGDDVLPAGRRTTYTLEAGLYDLMAQDCSGTTLAEQYGIEISGDMEWDITYGSIPGAVNVTFVNRTSEPVCYVWFGPPNSEWYGDALSTRTIDGWGSVQVPLPQETLVLQAEDCSGMVMMRAEAFWPTEGGVWEINP